MRNLLYIALFFSLILGACSSEETPISPETRSVELQISVNNFTKSATQSTKAGTEAENTVDNLYVFLFSESQPLVSYYIDSETFADGSWDKADSLISLSLTTDVAGTRDVYIVANCADLKADLDGVDDIAGLQAVFRNTDTPWSSTITTPILMVGHKSHDFVQNRRLETVSLERAIAKVQLTIKLSEKQQSEDITQYKYRFVNFDKRTYVIKPDTKPDNLITSDWAGWSAGNYTTDSSSGKVTQLTLTTYLNERDQAGTAVEIILPYAGGFLPPPEFGDEIYKLTLPQKITRNTIYEYDVSL